MPKTRPVSLSVVVRYLETLLRHAEIADYPHALNGLQIENRGRIHRIGATVDVCEATLAMAVERGIDFLLVHHGFFWNGLQMITGANYRKLRLALDADIALFSSHFPLDAHPLYGNNALLAKALGFRKTAPFFWEKGSYIGQKTILSIDRDELAKRLEAAVGGPVKIIPGGPAHTRCIGVVSGGAGADLQKAAQEGVDTYITGETPHWTYPAAEELGLNLLTAGHYATETFGVKALAAHLAHKYRLPWEFLDHPSGL